MEPKYVVREGNELYFAWIDPTPTIPGRSVVLFGDPIPLHRVVPLGRTLHIPLQFQNSPEISPRTLQKIVDECIPEAREAGAEFFRIDVHTEPVRNPFDVNTNGPKAKVEYKVRGAGYMYRAKRATEESRRGTIVPVAPARIYLA